MSPFPSFATLFPHSPESPHPSCHYGEFPTVELKLGDVFRPGQWSMKVDVYLGTLTWTLQGVCGCWRTAVRSFLLYCLHQFSARKASFLGLPSPGPLAGSGSPTGCGRLQSQGLKGVTKFQESRNARFPRQLSIQGSQVLG